MVVSRRVKFMGVPASSLGMPRLTRIRGVRFKYSGGGNVAAGGVVNGMVIYDLGC